MHFPPRQSGEAPPTWLWMTALIAIAAFAGLVMFLDYHQKRDIHSATEPAAGAAANAKSETAAKKATKGKNLPGDGNKFDFYQLLPDLESIVNDSEVAKDKTPNPNTAVHNDKKPSPTKPVPTLVTPTESDQEFYLQVGAYKQYEAADRMKANLALLGLHAGIQRVDIGKVGRMHRVRLGPYTNIRDMRHDRQKLEAANIQSIMVRSKVASR